MRSLTIAIALSCGIIGLGALGAAGHGEHPVAQPRGAAGGRSSNISSIDVAVWRRVSCWPLTLPRGGECRVGRTLPRGGPSSPAHGRRRRGADPRHRQHRPIATKQTIDGGRRAAAARCRTERRTGGWRSSRTPQVDLACSSLSTGSRRSKRAMP